MEDLKRYTIKGKFFPVVCFDETPILYFNLFGYSHAKKLCGLLNDAFAEGYIFGCNVNESEIDMNLAFELRGK